MIDYSTYCKIHDYHAKQGLHVSQIAQKLALNPRTVVHWLTVSRYQPRKTTVRASKLDPYKPLILKWLETHHYSAQQIFQRLREQGFDGGRSIVGSYVRKVRPKRPAAFLTLHFAPGDTAQVDWGSYGSVAVGETRRKLSFFVMVLCYSRMLYVEFTCSQTMEQFLACHQHAFAFFGNRVPKNIMVDNLRSAVLKRLTGQAPVFNPKYLDFAQHHGFTIKACNVRKGNETAPAHPAPAALVHPCTSKAG